MNKRRVATTAIAAFGAAMSSIYAAPELQADILDLTFTPSTAPYYSQTIKSISINQIGASFAQWNGYFGKTLLPFTLEGVTLVSASDTLNASTFVGGKSIDAADGFSVSAAGTAFVGFKFAGNVGWFSLNLGGFGGAITYLDGEYGSAGESVHVGGTVIPEPTTFAALGILALGAAGVRRNRKK